MSGIPDYTVESTIDFKFTTRRFSTGAPFALASGVISAYPDNSTTQITAGITLTADFDTVTGLNNVRVVATGANGYAAGSTYFLVITTGTVDSVSVVGEVIGAFSLGRSAAAVDLANGTDGLGAIKTDTAAILVDTGTTLDARIPAALVGGRMDANVGAISGDATAADNEEAFFDGTGYAGTGNVIPSVTTVTGNVNGSVGSVTGAVGSVTGAVGSVTGAVGSVTGAVGSVANITVSGGIVSADIKKVNAVTVIGDGAGTPWGP